MDGVGMILHELTDFSASQFAPGGSADLDLPLESFDMMKQHDKQEQLYAADSALG